MIAGEIWSECGECIKMAKQKGLRGIMYGKPAEEPGIEQENLDTDTDDSAVRINIRVSKSTLKWLQQEATKSATTVSGLCSLAIYDWVQERKSKEIVISDADILKAINDPLTSASTKEFLRKFLK